MSDVLSSGHIIAQPSGLDDRVFIIDRQGAETAITHSPSVDECLRRSYDRRTLRRDFTS